MSDLHPILKDILAQPENPNAVPVEVQDPDDAREEWKADMAAVDAPAPRMRELVDFFIETKSAVLMARRYVPLIATSQANPALVYFHGGGFIRGDIETHDSVCRVLANSSGCVVISAEYRLAPEHRFPAGAQDAYDVVQYVSANADRLGIDPERIAVGGDSAGGNMAIAACLQAKRNGGPNIRLQLLIYPVTDLATETESKRLFSEGYLLNSMPFYIASYLGPDGNSEDELASPVFAKDLSGLPPAYIITAGYDPLRDEGENFASRLAEHGTLVEYKCYGQMIHGFVSLRGLLAEADSALIGCAMKLASALK
ncbi:alpha/beta hydrolase [Pseudomonas cavernicola]|uniref:Alpha/beta hydrolase n=1 Tax=Pseudomonas cavernicola TaxID=2320866 RepID=A0A418X958_9PSED|nr:alpha/beta hydrolase [Pseudomonas cavernicola]RJG09014.1 alpha/beta hydrolase [Pseudomonas cavernicola]